jgi:hypothetical protein
VKVRFNYRFAWSVSSAALILGFTLLGAAAATAQQKQEKLPPGTVRFVLDRVMHLASPDGQWTLTNGCDGCPGSNVLWIVSNEEHRRRVVRKYNDTVEAAWSPDSKNFFLNDESPARTRAYAIDPVTLKMVEIEKLIADADSDSVKYFRAGHSHLEAVQWRGPNQLLVRLAGQFDAPTVAPRDDIPSSDQFELKYQVELPGSVRRISAREWDPEASRPTE